MSGKAAVTDPGKRPGFLFFGVAALLMAACSTFPGVSGAQTPTAPAGSPARFQTTSDSAMRSARIQDVRTDSVFFSDCGQCGRSVFSLNEVIRLDVAVRPPGSVAGRIAKDAGLGLLGAVVVGAAVGIIVDRNQPCHNQEWCIPNAVALPVLAAPLGILFGGWAGIANSRRKWINVIPGHI